jgi:hypothetical protein
VVEYLPQNGFGLKDWAEKVYNYIEGLNQNG